MIGLTKDQANGLFKNLVLAWIISPIGIGTIGLGLLVYLGAKRAKKKKR